MPTLENSLIYALHGFLGKGSDWKDSLQAFKFKNDVICPNYFSDEIFAELNLERFIHDIQRYSTQKSYEKKIFIGYSLGGRIGLRLLAAHQDLFDHYIFISTHPGLDNEADKLQRLNSDQEWVARLQQGSWSDFLREWNGQEVLKDSATAARLEEEFKTDRLISALTHYSLARQPDYRELISEYKNKITWIVGDRDTKFLNLAEGLRQKKILLDYKRIFSGHRILFDSPISLSEILLEGTI